MAASTSWREPAARPELRELRCRGCRRLLAKIDGRGRVEVVCRDCKTLTTVHPK